MYKIKYFVFSALAMLLAGCSQPKKSTDPQPRSVKVKEATLFSDPTRACYPAKIIATVEYNVAFRQGGMIVRIPVGVGQQVRQAETIAILDTRDYQTQLNATQARFDQVKAEYERVAALYKRGSVSPNDYEKATSGMNQLAEQLQAHKNALADCHLKAPSAGKIERINFKQGETIGAGMPVICMVDNERPEAEVFIPAEAIDQAKSSNAYFDKNGVHELRFVSLTPKATSGGLYKARYAFKNNDAKIRTGEVGNILFSSQPDQVVSSYCEIPTEAVFESDGSSYVWIMNETSTRALKKSVRPVKIRNNGNMILSGISAGDQVVVAGVHTITEDMELRILPQPSKTNIGGLK